MGKKHKKHHKSDKKYYEEEKLDQIAPIKLVLKKIDLPESDSDVYSHSPHPETKKHKHKKKKKKKSSDKHRHHDSLEKSRKRNRDEMEECEVSQEEEEPVVKKPSPDLDYTVAEGSRSVEVPQIKTEESEIQRPRGDDEHGVLKICLKYLLNHLQRKDVNGFFAYPVNDLIAPGYSNIILRPMDFSTMKQKIDALEYRNVLEYKKDFVLMCNNAMTYNRPETIYYKEAKRLLHIGMKMMSKEKLLNMKRSMPFLASLRNEELGIDEPDETRVVMEAIAEEERMEKKRAKAREQLGRYEAIPDNLTPEEILAQAQAAAKDAADMLTLRKPSSTFSFLRRREDGSTSLCVMNPENEGIVSETERVINLGSLIGKLTSGTGALAGVKEDKRNKVTPVTYLNYGPFSSFAPQYDSTFSNICKEESDLLLSTYGDDTGVQYAKSIMEFTENSGDYASSMVDHLLDILTKGEHSKTQKILDQRKEEEEKKKMGSGETTDNININSLRSLSELGVDVSFLDEYEKDTKDPVQEKLDQTASLINDLQQTQNERLSSKLPTHLAHVPGPSEKELQLAQKVTKELKELTKVANPGVVSNVQGIRSAMGVSFHPDNDLGLTLPSTSDIQTEKPAAVLESAPDPSQVDISEELISHSTPVGNDNDSEDIDISEFLQLPGHSDANNAILSNSAMLGDP